MFNEQSVRQEISGRTFEIQTGKMAKQANGSAVVKYADTAVLTAATKGKEKDLPFFPLTVEYREKTAAAGKIPGGFFKREGKPSTKETITARLTDRPIRPLFPDGIRNEIQVVTNVYSADKENDPDVLSINGASAALMLSDIPWDGPIGATRIGELDQNFVVNPTNSELEVSDLDVVVVSTEEGVVMVEGHGDEIKEQKLLEAIGKAHQVNVELCNLQKDLTNKAGKSVEKIDIPQPDPAIENQLKQIVAEDLEDALRIPDKQDRSEALDRLKEKAVEKLCSEDLPEDERYNPDDVEEVFDDLEKKAIRSMIKNGERIDGRDLDEVRPISCEIGIMPRTHGSSLFTRGETQAMATVTLGTGMDEQTVDGLEEEYSKKFMVHYNFPPFCVGEARPMRGPGRREIGHGMLAERALRPVVPVEDFPYTIRTDVDILESNGSSSMATVTGGSLALMKAGVNLDRHVAGVAIGLVEDEDTGDFQILTDILGDEDHSGDMDLKVAGTKRGITAVQMDIKTDNVRKDVVREALKNARSAREEIIGDMQDTIGEPREDISPHAPRIYHLQIEEDKIGRVIGPGGKTIREIEDETGADVEVDDDGIVTISSVDEESADAALNWVEDLVYEPSVGEIITGRVTGVKDFGAFVELSPGGLEGLCHVSELADDYVSSVEDVVSEGDEITVKILEIEEDRISLSRRAAKEEQEEEQTENV